MKTSYKFWYIRRDDNIHISECAIKFFEGDITTEDELNPNNREGGLISVTKYRRSRRLQASDLTHLGKSFRKDQSGDDCILYTAADFGVILDDDELRVFLNGELKKDPNRDPEEHQVEEDLNKLKKLEIK